MFVGKRRMRPADSATLTKLIERGFQQVRSTDFFVSLWGQPGDDQITAFIEEKVTFAVFHKVNGAPASSGHCGFVFPQAVTVIGVEITELAVAVDAVNVAVLEHWS